MTDQPDDTADTSPAKHRNSTTVTPFEAKVVWDTLTKPTDGEVAKHFCDIGRPVSVHTIGDWRNAGWKIDEEGEQRGVSDMGLSIGLREARTPEDLKTLNEELDRVIRSSSDRALLRLAVRANLAAGIKSSLAISRYADAHGRESPATMGAGIQRTAAAIPLAVQGMTKMELLEQKQIQAIGAMKSDEPMPTNAPPISEADDLDPELEAFRREAKKYGASLQ